MLNQYAVCVCSCHQAQFAVPDFSSEGSSWNDVWPRLGAHRMLRLEAAELFWPIKMSTENGPIWEVLSSYRLEAERQVHSKWMVVCLNGSWNKDIKTKNLQCHPQPLKHSQVAWPLTSLCSDGTFRCCTMLQRPLKSEDPAWPGWSTRLMQVHATLYSVELCYVQM